MRSYRNKNITIKDRSYGIVTEIGLKYGMFRGTAALRLSMCEDSIVENCKLAYTYRTNNSPGI